jgi:hypothetical protein
VNKKKEEIIAEADNSDYIHGEDKDGNLLYETNFETGIHVNTIFTRKRWNGKVKITIEELK